MPTEADSAQRNGQGFVFGELLVAVLLLVVAVSSMAALMYSVSHRVDAREGTSCVASNGAGSTKCAAAPARVGGGPRLLRSDCDREGSGSRRCTDSATDKAELDAVIVRSRTDSAALAIAAKKQKATRDAARTDRGFVR
jgi:hypothetical protein